MLGIFFAILGGLVQLLLQILVEGYTLQTYDFNVPSMPCLDQFSNWICQTFQANNLKTILHTVLWVK